MVGWVEKVCILPGKFMLPAKVDTGAVTCCLHAPDVVEFVHNGEKWVRFHVLDVKGKRTLVERKVSGVRRIKRHFGAYQDRLVIRLGVCLGSVSKEVDVNLVDRSGFEYPMLIGRNFMEGKLVVNPSTKYTMEPTCGAIKQAQRKTPSSDENPGR
ncbi:MAG: RimK/LysX family protein [Desulfomonilaceae bacterium]